MKNQKSKIWLSGVSLAVCVAMLGGATFAWFSDTAANKGNRIQAGTLSVDLLKHDGAKYESIAGGTGDIFNDAGNGSNWEPGRSETVYLQVKNTGTLELKYNLDIKVLDEGLADVLELSVANPYEAASGGVGFVSLGILSSLMDSAGVISMAQSGELAAAGTSYEKGVTINDKEFFAVKVKMLESAGNTYQGLSFAADVILTATQTNKGAADDYDKDAALVKVRTAAELAATPANATAVLLNDLALAADVTIPRFVNIDYAGYTLDLGGHTLTLANTTDFGTADLGTDKSKGTVKNGNLVINYPQGTVNAYGTYTDVTFDVTVSDHTFNFYGVTNGGEMNLNDGRLVVQNGAEVDQLNTGDGSNAVINGSAGNVNAGGGSSVVINGSAGNVNAEAGSGVTVGANGAVTGTISGNGVVNGDDGFPYGAVILESGANIQAAIQAAADGATFYLKNGDYAGVKIEGTGFGKKITLIGESRNGVKLAWVRIANASADVSLKNIYISSFNPGSAMLYISAGTVRLHNCYFKSASGYSRVIEASYPPVAVYINQTEFASSNKNSYFNGNSLKVFTNNKYNSSSSTLACDDIQRSLMETVMTGNNFAGSNLYFTATQLPGTTTFEEVIASLTPAEETVLKNLLSKNTNLKIRFALGDKKNLFAKLDANGNFVKTTEYGL